MSKYKLKIYLTGMTKESKKAIKDLRTILDKKLNKQYDLEVIDIKENPQLAEDEKILATPVVERKLPLPVKRVIGKLSEPKEILSCLDLVSKDEKSSKKKTKDSKKKRLNKKKISKKSKKSKEKSSKEKTTTKKQQNKKPKKKGSSNKQ